MAEAAFYNKPAIQLGNLGITLKLPNVVKCNSMSVLTERIKEALKMDLKSEGYERRLENFVAAVFDVGFDFKYMTVWEKGKGDTLENLWDIYKRELSKIFKSK
jgi:hypothetical protein